MESQLEGFLNLLGEAERADGRVLHELTEQAKSLELREMLKKVGRDEGYYAGELVAHVRRLGGTRRRRLVILSRRCAPPEIFAAGSNCLIAVSDE
jgi:hypothetical protein